MLVDKDTIKTMQEILENPWASNSFKDLIRAQIKVLEEVLENQAPQAPQEEEDFF